MFSPFANGLTSKATSPVFFGVQNSKAQTLLKKQAESESYREKTLKRLPNTKVTVLGAAGGLYRGDTFDLAGKINPLLEDQQRYLFDPGAQPSTLKGTWIKSLQEIPQKATALVLSPHKFHANQLKALIQDDKVEGVYCEKPMVINRTELNELDKQVKTDKPLYFGDFYYFSGLGLMALMGKKVPYTEFLRIESDPTGKLSEALESHKPIISNPKEIKGEWLSDSPHYMSGRHWLTSKEEGGGVLLDIIIHYANLLNLMGMGPKSIETSNLKPFRDFKDNPYFLPHPRGQEDAEARAEITGMTENGIPYYLACKQFRDETDKVFSLRLIGEDNSSLSLGLSDGTVTYFDKEGREAGKLSLNDEPKNKYYQLMMDHALRYLKNPDSKGPLFYEEQQASLDWVERAREKAELSRS